MVAIQPFKGAGAVFTNHALRYTPFLYPLVSYPTIVPSPRPYLWPYQKDKPHEILRCFYHCAAVALRSRACPEIRRVRHQRGAIGGYDPVAYFTESKPVKGDGRADLQLAGRRLAFLPAGNTWTPSRQPRKVRPPVRRLLRLRYFSRLQSPH